MDKWDNFWNDILVAIKDKYERGNPEEWKESQIETFLVNMSSEIVSRLKEKPDLIKSCGAGQDSKGSPSYRSVTALTFRRIFITKESKGRTSTRNAFAIYLGYNSAEHFIYRDNTKENKELKPLRVPEFKESSDDPIPVSIELQNANFAKEDERDEWMIYELAFLWFGKEPSGILAHQYLMTREMESFKSYLHTAVDNGHLQARTVIFDNGITRYINRADLEEFVNKEGIERPEFLKKERRL